MIKQILITLVLLSLFVGVGSSTPIAGVLSGTMTYDTCKDWQTAQYDTSPTLEGVFYYTYSYSGWFYGATPSGCGGLGAFGIWNNGGYVSIVHGVSSTDVYRSENSNGSDSNDYVRVDLTGWGVSNSGPPTTITYFVSYSNKTGGIYTISGTAGCLDYVNLYMDNGASYVHAGNESCTGGSYSFDVFNNTDYYILFNDAHQYDFAVNGSNINYNHDACIKTWYIFKESCNNSIPDSEGFYIEKIGDSVHAINYFYAPSGTLFISESPADNIYFSANPFSGEIGWFLSPIINDTTYNLVNPYISWSLKVIVKNESDGSLIDDVMVGANQSCYCTDGHTTRQKMTVNGHADFTDMSLQDASLFCQKTGYKILDESSTGYSAFLSGRKNFSSKTWIVKLANSSSENVSTFYEVNNTVNIFFVNEDGNRTSQILDTDSEVYLYYENNNTDNEDMTLRFESSSTHTYFMPELQWNIPHGEIGHKTIANSYFTPYDYSYRAVIYNSSIYGWNMTIPLTVRNNTKETEQHYENLSTYLWFMESKDGKIDYRNDMGIGIHACSNNTTLMYVDIELYKDTVLLCYKNMTSNNFINADFPYYYIWSPSYSYVSGSNYSIRMFGFDRTLLETDFVNCYTDDITRKNKLTIIVKNHYGTNLDNVFVYLEDYGSLPTGTNYYNSYEGLDNGYYRFKAAKSGYTGTGWDDITLSDNDETVVYVLTASDTEEGDATQQQKMDDTTLRNLYIPLMALLLILILFGGLKSVL